MKDVVTVEELFSIAPLNTKEILCGWNGRVNRIERVVNDVEQPLIDALFIVDASSNPHDLIQRIFILQDTPPAAIAIIGDLSMVKQQIVQAMEVHSTPVLKLSASLSHESIQKTFQFIQTLKREGSFYHYFQETMKDTLDHWNEKGPVEFLKDIEFLIGHRIYIVDPFFDFMFSEQTSVEHDRSLRHVMMALKKKAPKDSGLCNKWEAVIEVDGHDQPFMIFNIESFSNVCGYLIVQENKHSQISDFEKSQVQRIVPLFSLQVQKQLAFLNLEKKYQQTFFYDLINNNFDSQYEIINQANIWGWDFSQPYQLILMNIQGGESIQGMEIPHMIERITRNTLSSYFKKPIITEVNQHYLVLYPDKERQNPRQQRAEVKEIATKIKERLDSTLLNAQVRIGIGRFYQSTIDLCRSYQEARTSLDLSAITYQKGPVMHFDDLGVVRLLAMMRQELLEDFRMEHLSELIQFDDENDGDLVTTLSTYLNENGHLKATADQLHIHTNTLRYRIKK